MNQSLNELGVICDHAAGKLYDRPVDEDSLADVATILLLISARLRRAVGRHDVALTQGKRVAASSMALAAVDRKLQGLEMGDRLLADDEHQRVVDRSLHLVVRVLAVLGTPARPALGAM